MLKAVAGAAGIKHFWNKQLASTFPTAEVWSFEGENEEQIWTEKGICRKGNSGSSAEK